MTTDNLESTANRVRVTYQHPVKENVILEVVGTMETDMNADTVLVRRIDGVLIDIPRINVLKFDQLT